MIRRYMTLILGAMICLLNIPVANAKSVVTRRSGLECTSSSQQQTPVPVPQPTLDKRAEKAARQIRQIGIGGHITLFLRNGDELHGTVSKIDSDSMQISEIDRHDNFTVKYSEINKVREGVGNVNVFTGKRVTRAHGLRIAGLIIAGSLIAIPLIIVAASKD